MSQPLPVFIEPLRFAETRRTLSGSLGLQGMERLAEYLSDGEGEVVVSLSFDEDEHGIPHARLRLDARLNLICQRCLGACETSVRREVMLAFTRNPGEVGRLGDHGYEPVVLERNEKLLRDLVEDELLLALPMIPRHDDEDCRVRMSFGEVEDAGAAGNDDNPFAVLARLKRRDRT